MNDYMRLKNLSLNRNKNGSSFTLLVPELRIGCGQTLAVVGQSGCGKSTLTDMLALILKPDGADEFSLAGPDGTINLLNTSKRQQAYIRGRYIGYVLQSGGLFPFLSVLENIMLPAKLLGMSSSALRDKAKALAVDMGIGDQIYKKPQFLSGGQRQRVAIARALIHDPKLVLADEPTAAVDSVSAEDICEVLKKAVNQHNAALVIVSHDRALMRRHADYEVTFKLERRDGILSTLLPPVKISMSENSV